MNGRSRPAVILEYGCNIYDDDVRIYNRMIVITFEICDIDRSIDHPRAFDIRESRGREQIDRSRDAALFHGGEKNNEIYGVRNIMLQIEVFAFIRRICVNIGGDEAARYVASRLSNF